MATKTMMPIKFSTRETGGSVKPEVERSGTPGQDAMKSERAKHAKAHAVATTSLWLSAAPRARIFAY